MKENFDAQSALDAEILESNREILESIQDINAGKINVFSRDWTIETIYNQIKQGNIELSPKFQRRNAWNDEKRSVLIESILLRLPIPEIVLAENHLEPNKFIVIDGRQRLMSIVGFINNSDGYWDKPVLSKLQLKRNLNGKSYEDLLSDESMSEEKRNFENGAIRCTVIFGQKSDDLLYQIFYRINSGAVPLSMQELRQALQKGWFSDFLVEITNTPQPIHKVLGLDKPHDRLIDAEIILKYFAFQYFGKKYKGDLKLFLNEAMQSFNKDVAEKKQYLAQYEAFNRGIGNLKIAFSDYAKIGKLSSDARFKINLFEVQILYFSLLDEKIILAKKSKFLEGFKKLSQNNEFTNTFAANTTTKKNYQTRFQLFENMVNQVFGTTFKSQFLDYEPAN
jgi:Protein of unknown function DUF262